MTDAHRQELTPVPVGGYVYGLFLGRVENGATVAAWVEQDGSAERVCWRMIADGELAPVRSLPAVTDHPRDIRFFGDRLIWCELIEGQGTLYEAQLSETGELTDGPRTISPLEGVNCGAPAVVAGNGAMWMLVESWQAGGCRLRLLTDAGDGWRIAEDFAPSDAFCIRPRLAAGADGVWASWDQYADGRYRVGVARADNGGQVDLLPAPDDVWESLSEVVAGPAGGLFAARCRERPVDQDGSVLFHSELVAAVRDSDGWRDVATVDIDYGLNPWESAYWGFRRFPIMIPDGDGVWLAWEEKIDSISMGPGPGRLCGQLITADGPQGRPVVLIDYRCMFIVERPMIGPKVSVATKTQWEGFEFHLPYELHTLDLSNEKLPRPSFLPNLGHLPTFRPRPRRAERPEMGELKLFFGDLHIHSHLSCDLPGEPDELYHFARDVAGMDFVCFTENDATRFTEPLTPGAWEHSRRLAESFNTPDQFTAFVGWEYTLHESPKFPKSYDSHRSVVFPGFDGRVVSWTDYQAPTTADLAAAFKGQRVLLHHHHGYGMDITDDSVERNVEVASAWLDQPSLKDPDVAETLHGALAKGLRLGLFAAGDVHERNPGLAGGIAGVWASDNTREAIFEAFWNHRAFATTGVRPDLRFDVCGAFMGSEVETAEAPVAYLSVECDVAIISVQIIRDGDIVHEAAGDGGSLELTWTDADCPPGEHGYYAHVRFEGDSERLGWNVSPAYGPDAWTSPVWVRRA